MSKYQDYTGAVLTEGMSKDQEDALFKEAAAITKLLDTVCQRAKKLKQKSAGSDLMSGEAETLVEVCVAAYNHAAKIR